MQSERKMQRERVRERGVERKTEVDRNNDLERKTEKNNNKDIGRRELIKIICWSD